MRLLQKECGKCLRHPFLWIVCITFGLFQFLSIYTYVGNAGMRKELRQMHVAVTDEETASPEYESAYADYKKTYGGMYDTLDMRKILEQKEKKSGYEPQGAWGMWIVRNYDRLQKRVEQIRKTGEGTYAFYPGSWYKLHSTLYGKLWKKLILQTAVLMILSMLYLMDYERIYKTQDLVLATTTGKKMMEKKILVVDDSRFIFEEMKFKMKDSEEYKIAYYCPDGEGLLAAYEKYQPDVVLYDVLGDVVCGGFSMPMRNGYADKIFIVTSGENMAIHAGANIAMAVENFKNRGYATLGGLILNRRNVLREEEKVEELAEDFHTSIVGTLTRSDLVQQAEEQKKTVLEAFPESEMAEEYRILAKAILMKVREKQEVSNA